MTKEDKPIAIILPNWNQNEPRFIVEDAHDELADDRAFKNGKCVYNQRLGIVYTVEYVVDALNELGNEIDKLKEENEQLKIANAKWLDKSLQDRQIRYSNTNHKELTKKYLLLKEENEQLRKQCFELEKDYLIETSDISDKIYLDDEIKELKQKYGVKDE